MNNPKYILLHTSDYPLNRATVQFWLINRWHRDKGFTKHSLGYFGGYHYLIDGDGHVRQYRKEDEEGAHCAIKKDGVSMNFQSIAICFSGDGDIELPTKAQIEAAWKLIKGLQEKYNIPDENIQCHRDYDKHKTCPGIAISNDWIKQNLINFIPEKSKKQQEELSQYYSLLDSLRALLLKLQQLLYERT